jgi:hypothetical protein
MGKTYRMCIFHPAECPVCHFDMGTLCPIPLHERETHTKNRRSCPDCGAIISFTPTAPCSACKRGGEIEETEPVIVMKEGRFFSEPT